MIRQNFTQVSFYIFLFIGFVALVLFTGKNISAQLAFFGIDYGKIVSLKDYVLRNKEQAFLPNQISFVGDIMLARHVETLMQRYDADYLFNKIDILESEQGFLVGNFEGSIPEKHKKTPDFHMAFSVDKRYLSPLSLAGFTHLSLANNHSFDYQKSGFKNTEKTLTKNSFVTFGHPTKVSSDSVTFMETKKQKVALIGLHTLFTSIDAEDLLRVFTYANNNSDFQVVYIHWGVEYDIYQNEAQRKLAKNLVMLGADLVVGHHPHVVQGVEEIDGVPIFYSLGNFVFDQYFSSAVKEGLVLDVKFDDDIEITMKPVISRLASSQPEFMTSNEKAVFLKKLADRSSSNLVAQIIGGRLTVTEKLATSPEMVIISE